jgi:hypothetical protein
MGGTYKQRGVGHCVAGFAEPSGLAQITIGNCLPAVAEVATAVEVRDPNLMNQFNEMCVFLGLGEIILEWWEQRFGTVCLGAIYGDQFWEGFSTMFREYIASSKLHLQPAEEFRIVLLRKPAPSDPDDTELDSFIPSYCVHYNAELYIVISICTVIKKTTPKTVHRSWLTFCWESGNLASVSKDDHISITGHPAFQVQAHSGVRIRSCPAMFPSPCAAQPRRLILHL